RVASVVRALTEWLCEQQNADDSWPGTWHVSPYYAIVSGVTGLPGNVSSRLPQGGPRPGSLLPSVIRICPFLRGVAVWMGKHRRGWPRRPTGRIPGLVGLDRLEHLNQ